MPERGISLRASNQKLFQKNLTYDEEGSVRDFVVSYIPKRELIVNWSAIIVIRKPGLSYNLWEILAITDLIGFLCVSFEMLNIYTL